MEHPNQEGDTVARKPLSFGEGLKAAWQDMQSTLLFLPDSSTSTQMEFDSLLVFAFLDGDLDSPLHRSLASVPTSLRAFNSSSVLAVHDLELCSKHS